MLRLRSALETVTTSLAAPSSLGVMVTRLERGLSSALHPAVITINLTEEATAAGAQQIPLCLDGDRIGGMLVASESDGSEVEEILRLLAAPIAAAIACRRRPDRRAREGHPANTDALCRIPNRRGFDEHLQGAWDRASARNAPLVMALADVDFFKTYNDRYGHSEGDRCLQQVASLLVKRRDGDDGFAARYGGEEFVLVFEATTLERAVAEVLGVFDRLAALHLEHAGTTLGRVSMSAGLAVANPARGRPMVELIDDADRALYRAKRLGRNRICAGTFVSSGPVVAKLSARRRAHSAADVPTFGRDDDLARILSALGHARMLTLVGPRGIGKSRLLELVADEALRRLHRPVVFVEAELLRTDMDPATALASACDLSLDAGGALETVTDFLADREAIVILEDVEPARADIRGLCNHLCARTVGVSIVAAAHAPLGISAERTIVVPPLDDEAAFQLLSFSGAGDGAAGRDIVRHLGGNPASIEAAAGWIASLGVSAVMQRLARLGGVYSDPEELAAVFSTSARQN